MQPARATSRPTPITTNHTHKQPNTTLVPPMTTNDRTTAVGADILLLCRRSLSRQL